MIFFKITFKLRYGCVFLILGYFFIYLTILALSTLVILKYKQTSLFENFFKNLFMKYFLVLFLLITLTLLTCTIHKLNTALNFNYLINEIGQIGFGYDTPSTLFNMNQLSDSYSLALPFLYSLLLVTFMTLIFTFTYNKQELYSFSLFIIFIFIVGFLLFFTNSFIFFFFYYESLLLPSFYVLYRYAKTRKAVEAAYLMFFWTQFGALFLIFAFQYIIFVSNSTKFSSAAGVNFSNLEINFLFVLLFLGFGVKFPVWPFYDWLPKAHVEASTNFSIFLSGVLVKLAFFGFYKCLLNLSTDISFLPIIPVLLVGLADSVFKIFYQLDLKKIIAYSTVIEMHWLTLALVLGSTPLWYAASAMILSHALLSSAMFFIVDYITRRFKTRLLTELSGVLYLNPDLYTLTLLILIVFLGFPGTLFFFAEFLFFSFLADFNLFVFIFIFFFVYLILPVSFIHSWFRVLFGSSVPNIFSDKNKWRSDITFSSTLTFTEKGLIYFILIQLFWCGYNFQFFII